VRDMIIYRDDDDRPTHVANLIPSELGAVLNWARIHGFELGRDIIQLHREYVARVAEYCHGLKFLCISSRGPDLPCAEVWHVYELVQLTPYQLHVPETEEDDRGGIVKTFVGSFTSANDDGLYSNETNDVLYVPIG